MSLPRLQKTKLIYKIQSHFDILTINMWNLKVKTYLESICHYITFYSHSKQNKILMYKLNKIWEDLHAEKNKMLLGGEERPKKMEKQSSWTERFNMINIQILLKLISRFNAFTSKSQQGFFFGRDRDKLILKFVWKDSSTWNR